MTVLLQCCNHDWPKQQWLNFLHYTTPTCMYMTTPMGDTILVERTFKTFRGTRMTEYNVESMLSVPNRQEMQNRWQLMMAAEDPTISYKIRQKGKEYDGTWRILMNYELDELINGADIVRFVKSQKIAWMEHLMRMESDRISVGQDGEIA
ncbi:hypothetical protein C0J52_07035 [Blattella germanica]|nr:hypothetical protein C0J52_07035 [Blattella germanica]